MSLFGGPKPAGGSLFGGAGTSSTPQTGAQLSGFQPQKSLFGGGGGDTAPKAGGLFGGLSVNTGKPAGFGASTGINNQPGLNK